jgi:apolipoprotein N-acyltransferase
LQLSYSKGIASAVEKVIQFLSRHPRWIALLAGAASATGFAPLNWWPVTLICFALFMYLVAGATSGRRAALIGWLFGVGHFTIGNNWIAVAFTFQAAMPAWLGWIAVVVLALYLAIYPALCSWGAHWIGRRVSLDVQVKLPFILAFAGCWIITEWLRSWVFTGFAWNPLGATWQSQLELARVATIIGTYGLSAVVVGVAGILLLALNRHWRATAAGLAIVFAIWLNGVVIRVTSPNNEPRQPEITIVQPNISQADKYAAGYDVLNFAKLAQYSRPLPNQGSRLLLWPEAAIPDYLESGYPNRYYQSQPGESAVGARLRLTTLMGSGDILLTGSNRLIFDKRGQLTAARNSMTAMDAQGNILGDYDKAHLVPYGEYLPLKWLLTPLGLSRLVPGDIDFLPGPGAQTMTLKHDGRLVKIGLQICYEIIFSGQVVDRKDRPDFLFNPSNDAWFGSWGPPQHLAQARLRAIEEGLPVVRATPTGISAVIDSDGRIVESLGHHKAGRIDARLPKAKVPTLFSRYGNVLPIGFALLLIALALLPLARSRSSR